MGSQEVEIRAAPEMGIQDSPGLTPRLGFLLFRNLTLEVSSKQPQKRGRTVMAIPVSKKGKLRARKEK